MTVIDIVIIVLALAGGVVGWRKSLSGQIGAIAALVIAIVVCRWFGGDAVRLFTGGDDPAQRRVLTTVLVYAALAVATYTAVRLLASFAGFVFKTLKVGLINRGAGAVFGAFEYLFGLSLLLNLWAAVFHERDGFSSDRRVNDAILAMAPAVLGSDTVKEILRAPLAEKPGSAKDADDR